MRGRVALLMVSITLTVTCSLSAVSGSGQGFSLRWTILRSARDARDAEMIDFDTRMDRRLVDALNTAEVFDGRLDVAVAPIDELLESRSAFASLHFNPTQPMKLAPREEQALAEFMARGGFLLLVENNYPYSAEIYRSRMTGTLFDFFAKDLPERDKKFRAEKLPLSHPIFDYPYRISVPPAIAREREHDPSYVGETVFFHEGRLVGFTFSLFGFDDGEAFVPVPRPFRVYTLMDAGHRVLVNIYSYALSH